MKETNAMVESSGDVGLKSGLANGPVRIAYPVRVASAAAGLWRALCSVTLTLTAVISAVVIVTFLVKELTQDTTTIEPIAMPKQLLERGYASDVAASRLRDAVSKYVAEANVGEDELEIGLHEATPDLVVPTVGLSLDSIASVIRTFLHSGRRRSITGEFTIENDRLRLRLRLDGMQFYAGEQRGTSDSPDELLNGAVPAVIRQIRPFIEARYAYANDQQDALEIAQGIIALRPETDENVLNALLLEARIYAARRQFDEARSAAQEAAHINPDLARVHNILGVILGEENRTHPKEDNIGPAIAEFRKAVAIDPEFSAAYVNIGLAMLRHGKYKEAEDAFRSATKIEPFNGRYHLRLHQILLEEGNLADSSKELWKAIEIFRARSSENPNIKALHCLLGQALMSEQRTDEAAVEFRKAAELSASACPGSPEEHNAAAEK